MTGLARRLFLPFSRQTARHSGAAYSRWEIDPGERIGAPRRRGHGKAVINSLALLGLLGAGWATYHDPSLWPKGWSLVSATVSPAVEQAMQGLSSLLPSSEGTRTQQAGTEPAKTTSKPDALPWASLKTDAAKPEPPPAVAEKAPKQPIVIASAPPVRAVEPQQPPQAANPYEARAKAVGLHPDISRVLLAQLTETDYRNAGIAIRRALVETADDGVFTWPRERHDGLAVFEVRFVAGAATNCRRYVVTIEKSRWVTTALPVEKCGAELSPPKRP
jgi:hypothetical protein